jgi:hypothetical protein
MPAAVVKDKRPPERVENLKGLNLTRLADHWNLQLRHAAQRHRRADGP